jgi:hypothetical protein
VRRTDARRRERDRPEGVTQGFHVSVYKVDPRIAVLARNLLSNDDCRLALLNESEPVWPEMPLAIGSLAGSTLISLVCVKAVHWFHVPHHDISIPSVIPMVPGVLMYRALVANL